MAVVNRSGTPWRNSAGELYDPQILFRDVAELLHYESLYRAAGKPFLPAVDAGSPAELHLQAQREAAANDAASRPPEGPGEGEGAGAAAAGEADLNNRQQSILEAMLANEITSRRRRKSRAGVVRLVNRKHNPATYGRDFAALVKGGYLASQEGPTGGVWLTPKGCAAAQGLREPSA